MSHLNSNDKHNGNIEQRLDRLYARVGKMNQDINDRIELLERKVSRIVEESRVILNKPDFTDPEGLINKDNADYFVTTKNGFKTLEERNRYKPWKSFDLLKAVQERSKSIEEVSHTSLGGSSVGKKKTYRLKKK